MPVSDDRADPADSAFDSLIDALTAPLSRQHDISDHKFEHLLREFQGLNEAPDRTTTSAAGEQTPTPHAPTTRTKNIGVENCPDIDVRLEQLVGELVCARDRLLGASVPPPDAEVVQAQTDIDIIVTNLQIAVMRHRDATVLPVAVGCQYFAFLLSDVIAVQPFAGSSSSTMADGDEIIRLMHLRTWWTQGTSSDLSAMARVVIVASGDTKIGVVVEGLLSPETVTIEPHGHLLQGSQGIGGVTVVGRQHSALLIRCVGPERTANASRAGLLNYDGRASTSAGVDCGQSERGRG